MSPMKRFILLLPLCLAWAGCESLSDATSGVRERLSAHDATQSHLFSATPRATYDAARSAAGGMGYRFVRGGAAQGELEAVSGIGPGDTLRGSRQISLKAMVRPAREGVEVTLRLTEIIQDDPNHLPTETPLRDTP